MVNVTMIARNRRELTLQAYRSLLLTIKAPHWLHVLDDGSEPSLIDDLTILSPHDDRFCRWHRNEVGSGGAGIARNQIIRSIKDRQSLLYLSDNDVFFTPHWLDILLDAWALGFALGFKAISGYAHPFNRARINAWPFFCSATKRTYELVETHAIATQSWLMEWATFDKYGPFAEAPGVRQSEDVRMCQQIQADGGKVGYVTPFPVLNTSVTDSFGEPVPGADLIERPEGILVL